MSYEQRGVWANLVAGVAGYAAYLAIVVPRLFHTPATRVSYIPPLVFTTLAWVFVAIVVRSALEFAKPSDSGKLDVRDRDIARHGEHASRWCVLGGATAGLIGAMDHWDYFWIANAIWLGFVLWMVVGMALRLVAYHRGL